MRHQFTLILLFCALICGLPTRSCHAQEWGVLKDISIASNPSAIRFSNEIFSLYISKGDHIYFDLHHNEIGSSWGTCYNLADLIDVQINGQKVVATTKPAYLRHSVEVSPEADSATLHVTYGIGPKNNDKHRYELTCSYRLYPDEARLERSAKLTFTPDPSEAFALERFEGFLFSMPRPLLDRQGFERFERVDFLGSYPDSAKAPQIGRAHV